MNVTPPSAIGAARESDLFDPVSRSPSACTGRETEK